MKNLLVVLFILSISITEVFAYSLKVYDEYGNRVGTYKKEGDKYVLYDFNDKVVENPDDLIKNAPSQKTLTEYRRTFYDSNMIPIGMYRSGYYGNNGRYYPRGIFRPAGFYPMGSPSIVRPRANQNKLMKHPTNGTYFVDTRYPAFHEFK